MTDRFVKGQKVICVKDGWYHKGKPSNGPVENGICTIERFRRDPFGEVMIVFVEFPNMAYPKSSFVRRPKINIHFK
jgi:hypothetical protein